MGNVYVAIHDKGEVNFTKTFYDLDKNLFHDLNKKGWGIYFSVNAFQASKEDMEKYGVKTKRNIQFLNKLRYVFADLDIAKKGDGKTREEKDGIKYKVLEELFKKIFTT